jgi:hypothetical protein
MREVFDRPELCGAVFNLLPASDADGPYLWVEYSGSLETRQECKFRNREDFCAWANSILRCATERAH